ncbi:ATP-dependent 6-phosphofructokinase [Aliiglaciecola sp. 2_MG-2023]|uniref:6-phosphofructokinase n=1 Tax=Alteromonadaceae TaxID=72275 RepID=UPI0026E1DC8A|nr:MULTISPECIES: ATP-dependent 6-phosphofructokinase [unclassified Aliiglaciecola]MDO6713010.1 ATP-dependent 6-phosphofructokinase [Aliiglaciecola sp. 2_MG-2023]MDO6754049.1 ATP-dependent 6-phosphofructokinase [Aliiglaciecola sp. 1_MG-2023]
MRKIALLTSGGDAPGMNACIRAIVLTSLRYGLEVYGYRHGYNGLLEQEYLNLRAKNVLNIIQRGGTILNSARCLSFKSNDSAKTAAKNLDALGIEALLVIGGDGSFRGAKHLAKHWSGQVIGLPGTIDNDVDGTDATIGYYTAIETALDSIDKVRDTADAFERIFLIEVMGRHAGFIGLNAAIASAADHIMLPEISRSCEDELENLIAHIEAVKKRRGNSSYIVVIAENLWPEGVTKLAEILSQKTQIECRPVILGYVQRGGSPVSQDRVLATKLGAFAVEMALEGKTGVMVGEINQQLVCSELETSWQQKKPLDPYLVKIQQDLFDILKRP